MQTDQLEHFREKLRLAQEETRSMQAKNEVLDRFVDWFKINEGSSRVILR